MLSHAWVYGTAFALAAFGAGLAEAQSGSEPPWRRYGPNTGRLETFQATLAQKPHNTLCGSRRVKTESPLDKVVFDSSSLAELTPALAQSAGLVSMIAADRRDAVRSIAIHLLQSRGQWSAAASDGYFEYLLREADGVRAKAAHAAAVLGGVTGGIVGLLGGRFYDDVTGSFGYGGQWTVAGVPAGQEAGKSLLRTEFAISDDDALVEAVVDILIQHPCELSSTDALKALRS